MQEMLREEIHQLPKDQLTRESLTELFYQRIYRTVEHIRADIDCLKEECILRFRDSKDLHMVLDLFAVQIEEVVDNIKSDTCPHNHIRGIGGQKVCELCAMKIS